MRVTGRGLEVVGSSGDFSRVDRLAVRPAKNHQEGREGLREGHSLPHSMFAPLCSLLCHQDLLATFLSFHSAHPPRQEFGPWSAPEGWNDSALPVLRRAIDQALNRQEDHATLFLGAG